MANDLATFADVIELWPSAAALARDLKDVKDITVRAWKVRGIPAQYWDEVTTAARARGFEQVTPVALSRLAAQVAGRGPAKTEGAAA